MELICPRCDSHFEAAEWSDGFCPKCGNGYCYTIQGTADYSDCWSVIDWDFYS